MYQKAHEGVTLQHRDAVPRTALLVRRQDDKSKGSLFELREPDELITGLRVGTGQIGFSFGGSHPQYTEGVNICNALVLKSKGISMLFHNHPDTSALLAESSDTVLNDFRSNNLPTSFDTATIIASSRSSKTALKNTELFAKKVARALNPPIESGFEGIRVDVSQIGEISVISDWVWGF